MFYCKRCVTPSTRPRLTFNDQGVCNACLWHDKKQTEINWNRKWSELKSICVRYQNDSADFDCIVPCSGGKDGSYVAWQLKHEIGMNPLCITLRPQLQTRLGAANLENFIQSGFDHILLSPDSQQYRKYSRDFFIKQGLPKQPFVVGISSAIVQFAKMYGINLVIFGEQGEQEYGGSTEHVQRFSRQFLESIYYEGQNLDHYQYGPFWKMPTIEDLKDIHVTWFSLFSDWDPEKHAKFAKRHTGLEMLVGGSIGTFTNYSQLDDMLQDLHCYLQFVKFGFGRCTSDASIEIRRGRMTRDQGVKVVKDLDGTYPTEYHDVYLDYFEMTNTEFWYVIAEHANMDILDYTASPEKPYVVTDDIRRRM